MNFDMTSSSGASVIGATLILAVLALLAIGAVIAFLISLKRDRAYSRTALPELFSTEEEAPAVNDDDMQVLERSVFDVEPDDGPRLDDEDSNKLMDDIDRAQQASTRTDSPVEKPSFFRRGRNTPRH